MQSLKVLGVVFLAAAVSAQTPAAKPKPRPAAPKAPAAAKSTPTAPAASTQPAAGGKVVMTIGGEKVTEKEFEAFLNGLPEQYREAARGAGKRQIAEQYATVRLMANEARRRGVDRDPVVHSQVQFSTDNLLAGALFKQMQNDIKVDDAALRQSYDSRKNEFEEVKASHILIRFKGSPVPVREGQKDLTEEEALAKANEARKRLQAGEEFAKVAKELSDDTGSGAQGGDLGTFKRGQMVGDFEKAAFSLPPGQISEPVKTQFGYHIIKVEKHDTKTFEDVKADLERAYRPQAAREIADKLRASAGITYEESYFGPAQPAPAAPGAAGSMQTPAPPVAK